ncbi:MAG: pilus assembly FimT family protein [Desulfomonilia bacterium]
MIHRTGATLFEVLIVLVILSVLALLAVPGFKGFSTKKDLYRQAEELSGICCQVRLNAMRDGTTWRVVFSPDQQEYACFRDENGNGQLDAGELCMGPSSLNRGLWFGCQAPDGPNHTKLPADGVSFVNNRVSFSPMGTCNAGTIYLRSNRDSLAMRVLPASGSILLYVYDEGWKEL